jgi:arylformamidase
VTSPLHPLAEEGKWPRSQIDQDYGARGTVTTAVFEAEIGRYRSLSEQFANPIARELDVAYDPVSAQTLDVFGTFKGQRPAFVFIHGGYWRLLSKHDSAFMAGMLDRNGVVTVALDYQLAPAATLAEIVRQVRAAIVFLWREGPRLGIDPDQIYVGGSSAGGHLTAAVTAGGWHCDSGVPETIVKGALPISGLFQLAPIANSFVQDWMPLDDAAVQTLSPIEHMPRQGCPTVIAYAEADAAGFKRQSIGFHERWQQAGFQSTLLQVAQRNHFDVILDLTSEDSLLSQALLRMIHGRGSAHP